MQAIYEGREGLRASKLGRLDHGCHGNHTGLVALPGEMSQKGFFDWIPFSHVQTLFVCHGRWEGCGNNPQARWLLMGKVTGRENYLRWLLVGLGLGVLMVHAEVRLKEMLNPREDITVVQTRF